jgi:hypothetical protein
VTRYGACVREGLGAAGAAERGLTNRMECKFGQNSATAR